MLSRAGTEGPLSSDESQVAVLAALRHLGESLQGREGGPVSVLHRVIAGIVLATT